MELSTKKRELLTGIHMVYTKIKLLVHETQEFFNAL